MVQKRMVFLAAMLLKILTATQVSTTREMYICCVILVRHYRLISIKTEPYLFNIEDDLILRGFWLTTRAELEQIQDGQNPLLLAMEKMRVQPIREEPKKDDVEGEKTISIRVPHDKAKELSAFIEDIILKRKGLEK